jgi:hypothetical protein
MIESIRSTLVKLRILKPKPPVKQRFEVWYARKPTFNQKDVPLTLGKIMSKYVKVAEVYMTHMEDVFYKMQGEWWSPYGEAREYIRRVGLTHTSMSVGDLIRDSQGNWFITADVGFKPFTIWDYGTDRTSILLAQDREI